LRLCELLEQLLDPAGLRLAGVDDIDINVIRLPSAVRPLAKFAIAALTAPPMRKSGPGVYCHGPV